MKERPTPYLVIFILCLVCTSIQEPSLHFSQLMVYRELPPPDTTSDTAAHVLVNNRTKSTLIQLHSTSLSGNGEGFITYELSERTTPRIRLYNTRGVALLTIDEGVREAGNHQTSLKADGISSGLYFIAIEAEGQRVVEQVMIVR